MYWWSLRLFPALGYCRSTAMNTGEHKFFCIGDSGFLGYTPSKGMAGSKGSSIFSFLRKFHTVFHSGSNNLHSTNSASLFSASSPALVVCWFIKDGHSDCVRWYPTVVLICISLMASDVKYPFICLWALCMSALEKCLFRSFSHFLVGLFVFPALSHVSSSYILEIEPFSKVLLANMFYHTVGFFYILMMFSSAVQKLFNLVYSHLFILSFISFALEDVSVKILLHNFEKEEQSRRDHNTWYQTVLQGHCNQNSLVLA